MGYKISVNLDTIERASETLQNNAMFLQKQIIDINSCVSDAKSFWDGEDYLAFLKSCNDLSEVGSTNMLMVTAIQDYAEFLANIVAKYRQAQMEAISESNGLNY